MNRKIGPVIGLLLTLLPAGSAWGHGGGPGLDYDPCAQQIGLNYVHMATYQPQQNWLQEYCGTIPAGGVTLFVFDLIGAEMRHKMVSVELMELGGETGGAVNLVSIPSGEHVSGVINFSATLQPGHSYQAVVTVGKAPASYTLTFPISVDSWWNAFEIPGLLVLAVLWGSIYYCLRLRREHLASLRQTGTRGRLHIPLAPDCATSLATRIKPPPEVTLELWNSLRRRFRGVITAPCHLRARRTRRH